MRRRRTRSIDNKILDGYLTRETRLFLAEEVKALTGTMRITVEELISQLLPWAAEKATVPISRYKVGAICRGSSGILYVGANLEFQSQALNTVVHAEQSAIANAMANGEQGIKALAVSAAPCGMCRQFLAELNSAETLTIQISSAEPVPFKNLLPERFGPDNLDKKQCLFDPPAHQLTLEKETDDQLAKTALNAANASYAPYSESPAGVAIQTRNGQVFSGHYIENAAYNPSLLPLQACLSNLNVAGRRFQEISDAVLVCKKGPAVDHVRTARQLFDSVCETPLRVFAAK